MKKNNLLLCCCTILFFAGCASKTLKIKEEITNLPTPSNIVEKAIAKQSMASAATILAKKEVPVLCYHHIRTFSAGISASMKNYSVFPEAFAAQMKILHDSGYHTILPDQLYDYLVFNALLPDKPVMLTFDDTDEEQYSLGNTEMKKYGFKGVFFIMTISMNRPRYMSKEQIKNLSDSGNVIAGHTWDHHMVTKYTGTDWEIQLNKPQKQLETITGKPIMYFAYPFGLWNEIAIKEIKDRGYKLAFSLSTKRDTTEPLYTIRRILVPGTWSATGMLKAMRGSFNK